MAKPAAHLPHPPLLTSDPPPLTRPLARPLKDGHGFGLAASTVASLLTARHDESSAPQSSRHAHRRRIDDAPPGWAGSPRARRPSHAPSQTRSAYGHAHAAPRHLVSPTRLQPRHHNTSLHHIPPWPPAPDTLVRNRHYSNVLDDMEVLRKAQSNQTNANCRLPAGVGPRDAQAKAEHDRWQEARKPWRPDPGA